MNYMRHKGFNYHLDERKEQNCLTTVCSCFTYIIIHVYDYSEPLKKESYLEKIICLRTDCTIHRDAMALDR